MSIKVKVPEFLLKDNKKKNKLSLEKTVRNLASFLANDYQKYNLGVRFEIDINYLNENVDDVYSEKTRYQMICHMLENFGTGILTTEDGTTYKCYDARALYDICSDFNQLNKKFKIAAARRKVKEGRDFRLYNSENVFVVYKGSGFKIRKIKTK